MAYKDNSVVYGFGQMGQILVTGTSLVTSNEETGMSKARFVALTFIEDTVFDSDTEGLSAETSTQWLDSTGRGDMFESANAATTDGITFPKGMTIYGRWTGFKLASGKVVAYIGY